MDIHLYSSFHNIPDIHISKQLFILKFSSKILKMSRKGMPAELINELFGSFPLENAFGLLSKMPIGLLARNVQKMINLIKEAMKSNKLYVKECGPILAISEDGLVAKHSSPEGWNCVRTVLPIPSFNLKGINKPIIAFYFEMQILNKSSWDEVIEIGFCDQQFQLEGKWLGWENNSFGMRSKGGIWIDGKRTAFGNANYFNKGDYIGIGIIQQPNFSLECFATWNGKLLGKAQLPAKFSTIQLFPAVELYSDGDSVRINFGKEEWQFEEFGSVIEFE